MSQDPVPGSAVPNQFIVTLHASADFDAHIKALQEVIEAANASSSTADENYVVSRITLNTKEGMGLPMYGGIFSPRVLKWIKVQEGVETVANDEYAEED